MKLKYKETVAGYALVLPSIAGFVIFFAAPFLVSLYYCFTKGIGGTEFVAVGNFIELLGGNSFQLAAKNTLKLNLVSVPSIMIVFLAFAMFLNRRLKSVSYFRTFFILPLVIPVASIILVWQILFSNNGVMNGFIIRIGLQPVEWLNSGGVFYILVLLYIWKNCGYNMILFLAGLNSIPSEYYESKSV